MTVADSADAIHPPFSTDVADRAQGIDAMRFAAIAAVVFLHANDHSVGVDLNLVCRFGVPFFFLTAGLFFSGRKDALIPFAIHRVGRRILAPFVFWLVFYILFFRVDPSVLIQPRKIAHMIITGGPAYHLWFLSSLALCMLVFHVLVRVLSLRQLLAVAALLYLVGLIIGPYSEAVLGVSTLGWNPRNGPFFGLPFMIVGYAMRQVTLPRRAKRVGVALFVLGAAISAAEVIALTAGGSIIRQDLLLGTVPLAIGALVVAMKLPASPMIGALAKLGRYSLGMFAIHLAVLTELEPILGGPRFVDTFAVAAATLVVTAAITLLLGQIRPIRPLVR